MSSTYQEYRPAPALTPFVECYWSRASGAAAGEGPAHSVLPDGCMDIVFNFGEVWTSAGHNGSPLRRGIRGGAVVGTMTAPLVVSPGAGEDFFGVRFRPGMAPAFLRARAAEFTDSAVPLDQVWGRGGAALSDELAAAQSARRRVARLERELLLRLADARPPEPCVAAALHFISRGRGAVSIRAACQFAGVTRQHLARRFAEHVGVPPKLFARVARFQGLLAGLRCARPVGWSEAAAHAGYYDQSHLIADFRQFAGTTPERFLASRSA